MVVICSEMIVHVRGKWGTTYTHLGHYLYTSGALRAVNSTRTIFGTDRKMFGIGRKISGIDRTMFGIYHTMFGIDRKMFGIGRLMFGINVECS